MGLGPNGCTRWGGRVGSMFLRNPPPPMWSGVPGATMVGLPCELAVPAAGRFGRLFSIVSLLSRVLPAGMAWSAGVAWIPRFCTWPFALGRSSSVSLASAAEGLAGAVSAALPAMGALLGAGAALGAATGALLGATAGTLLGAATGALLGPTDGTLLGAATGALLGPTEGALAGAATGALLGATEGTTLGAATGGGVGVNLNALLDPAGGVAASANVPRVDTAASAIAYRFIFVSPSWPPVDSYAHCAAATLLLIALITTLGHAVREVWRTMI